MLSDGNNPNGVIVEDIDKRREKKTSEQTAPYEHCPDCYTRTGGGRCGVCKDLIQNESAFNR